MGSASVQQMAERVAGLLEERLGIKGDGLREKLRRGGGRLPRKLRREMTYLAESAEKAANPEYLLHLDHERVAQAYDDSLRHLSGLGPLKRRGLLAPRTLVRIAVNLLIVGVLLAAFLLWRGLI